MLHLVQPGGGAPDGSHRGKGLVLIVQAAGVTRNILREELEAEGYQIALADDIIVNEVQKFFANRTFAGMTPLVEHLKVGFGDTLDDHVPAGHEARDASERLARKLLGLALETLKKSSRTQHSVEQIRAAYELFLRGQRGTKETS